MGHGNKITIEDIPKNGVKTLKRLFSYLVKDWGLLLVILVLILVNIVAGLTGSYMLRPIINDYIIPGDIPGLIRMLFILGGIYLVGALCVMIEYRLLNKIGQYTVTRIRKDLFGKMELLPVKYFDTHQHGDIMSRYTNDIDKISDVLTDNLTDLLSSILMFVGILVLMIYISPILTLVVLVMIPLMMFSAKLIAGKSRKYFRDQQCILGQTNGYIEEMISGQKVVKVFGHEKDVENNFEKLNQNLRDKSGKAQLYSGMMMPAIQNLGTLNFVVITIVGALLAIFRGFDVGGLAAFIQYSRQFTRPIIDLATLYNNIQAAIAGAERIFQLIDEPVESDSHDVQVVLEPDLKDSLQLIDVVFGYNPEKPVLRGISFSVNQGAKVALVGATGAGKTTILNMLPRFYDIQSGQITINGISIYDMKRADLRHSMAIVLQDTHLFTGTVRENIRFGRLEASDEEVEQAACLSAAHSFISRLPQGYDTMLTNDGENLSQGQRQLLNIARAAIADPAILLFDEATSNIDTRSEIAIQKGLDKLMKGRISLIIAHRLSTVRNADTILVLDDGNIVERGSHPELIARRGHYYKLYQNQFDEM